MAGSSSSANGASWSSSRSRRPRVGEDDFSSPIPYREGPLEYGPPVFCDCNKKSAKWISWSDDNPGRRYYKCFNARRGGCGFWQWIDSPGYTTLFVKKLLQDLRDAVRGLKKENKAMETCLAEEGSKLDKSLAEVDMLLEVLAEKDATIDDLNANVKKLRKMAFMFGVAVVFLVVVVVGCCRIEV